MRLSPLVLIAALVQLLVASPTSAQSDELQAKAEAEGKLVVYTTSQIDVNTQIINGFRRLHPKITVEFFGAATNPTLNRFEAETAAGRHIVDVVWLTDKQSKLLHARGLLASHRSKHLGLYPAELHAKDDAWANFALTLISVAWNSDLVKPADAPKSWTDLLDPKWRGKLAMQEPLTDGGSAIWFATMLPVLGNDEARWMDYMRRLGQQRLRFGQVSQVQEMVVSGEVLVQVAGYPNFIEPVKAKGAPIEWGTPDPVIFTGLSLNIPKTAPHPNAARLFVDYMLSEETQELMGKLQLLPALRSKWPAAYERLKSVKMVPQAHELEAARFDFFQERKREAFPR